MREGQLPIRSLERNTMIDSRIEDPGTDKANNDNHSNQMNPNNDAYWSSRGDGSDDDGDDD